jgi:uncharacterized protein YukE
MGDQLTVELSDLRAWADQVGRGGADCTALASYVDTFVPDGDFGRILSLITGDYEAMVHQVHTALGLDGTRLDDTGHGLHTSANAFRRTDSEVAQDFGVGAHITDDGHGAGAFNDTGTTTAAAPTTGGEELPEVSFGWILDKACELISWLGGPDLRAEVTEQIAGDVGKASLQASAWDNASLAMGAVRGNLTRGEGAIERSWQGRAAISSTAYLDQWLTALGGQENAMAQVASYLRDMVKQSVDLAQVVVDVVKEICSIISAGWSMASIPIYGQIKLVDKVKDAIKLVNDARKVIAVFWNFLVLIKDYIITVVDYFSADSLPAAPVVPVGAS